MKNKVSAAIGLFLSFSMLAQSALTVSACDLSREELAQKYALQIQTQGECDHDEVSVCIEIDENGIGDDGIDYGMEHADGIWFRMGENLMCSGTSGDRFCIGDYKTDDHYFFVEKQDGTVSLISLDIPYFKAQGDPVLRVPETLGEKTVTEIGVSAFMLLKSYYPSLEEIVLPDTIETIQTHAFYKAFNGAEGCKINIPGGVKYIGCNAYANLRDALGAEVTLPESLEYIDGQAFNLGTFMQKLNPPKSNVVVPGGSIVYYRADTYKCLVDCEVHSNLVCTNSDLASLTTESITDSETSALPEQTPEAMRGNGHAQSVLIGDVYADGTVDVKDAVLLAQYVGNDEVSDIAAANADLNSDGAVNTDDLTALMRKIANLA